MNSNDYHKFLFTLQAAKKHSLKYVSRMTIADEWYIDFIEMEAGNYVYQVDRWGCVSGWRVCSVFQLMNEYMEQVKMAKEVDNDSD